MAKTTKNRKFRLPIDMTPAEAELLQETKVAINNEKAQAVLLDVRLGTAMLNILDKDNKVQPHFGEWNNRPINDSEVKRLLRSFEEDGIYRMSYPLPVTCPGAWIDLTSLEPGGSLTDEKKVVNFTEATGDALQFQGGQHRQAAAMMYVAKRETERSAILGRMKKLEESDKAVSKAARDKYTVMKNRMATLDLEISRASSWAVTFYDSELLLKKSDEDRSRAYLALSSNKTLFQHSESDEETLVDYMRQIDGLTPDDDVQAFVAEVIGSLKRNYKLIPLFQNPRVRHLVATILRFPYLRKNDEVFVNQWMVDAYVSAPHAEILVWKFQQQLDDMIGLCTASDVVTAEDLLRAEESRNKSTTLEGDQALIHTEEGRTHFRAVRERIREESQTPAARNMAREVFTAELMAPLDQLYKQFVQKYMAYIGTSDGIWHDVMSRYSHTVLKAVAEHYTPWEDLDDDSRPTDILGQARAKLHRKLSYVLSGQIGGDPPIPLMHGMYMVLVDDGFRKVEFGTREVMRWLDPLSEWNPILSRAGKRVAGQSEMVHKKLCSRPGLQPDVAQQIIVKVYEKLWVLRATHLARMQLEYPLLSAKQYPRAMKTLESPQNNADLDFIFESAIDWAKTGIWKRPDDLNLILSQEFMAHTAWDWKPSGSHNIKRDIGRLCLVAINEGHLVTEYRGHLLASPTVQELRMDLLNTLTHPSSVWKWPDDVGRPLPGSEKQRAKEDNSLTTLAKELKDVALVVKQLKDIECVKKIVEGLDQATSITTDGDKYTRRDVQIALQHLIKALIQESNCDRERDVYRGEQKSRFNDMMNIDLRDSEYSANHPDEVIPHLVLGVARNEATSSATPTAVLDFGRSNTTSRVLSNKESHGSDLREIGHGHSEATVADDVPPPTDQRLGPPPDDEDSEFTEDDGGQDDAAIRHWPRPIVSQSPPSSAVIPLWKRAGNRALDGPGEDAHFDEPNLPPFSQNQKGGEGMKRSADDAGLEANREGSSSKRLRDKLVTRGS